MYKLKRDEIITDSFDKGSVNYHWTDCDVCKEKTIFVLDEDMNISYCITCGTEI